MKPFELALREYGTQEILGGQHNPRILEYFEKVGHDWVQDDETAWCAAFVGWCLESAGIPSTKKLNAQSYMKWGKVSLRPKLGDLVVFWRITPTSGFGHVGFLIRVNGSYIWVLGGNQENGVCITKYPTRQLLGFRTV